MGLFSLPVRPASVFSEPGDEDRCESVPLGKVRRKPVGPSAAASAPWVFPPMSAATGTGPGPGSSAGAGDTGEAGEMDAIRRPACPPDDGIRRGRLHISGPPAHLSGPGALLLATEAAALQPTPALGPQARGTNPIATAGRSSDSMRLSLRHGDQPESVDSAAAGPRPETAGRGRRSGPPNNLLGMGDLSGGGAVSCQLGVAAASSGVRVVAEKTRCGGDGSSPPDLAGVGGKAAVDSVDSSSNGGEWL